MKNINDIVSNGNVITVVMMTRGGANGGQGVTP